MYLKACIDKKTQKNDVRGLYSLVLGLLLHCGEAFVANPGVTDTPHDPTERRKQKKTQEREVGWGAEKKSERGGKG